MVARVTLWASSTATNKRQRDAIAGLPVDDILANSFDYAGKLMPWYMRQTNVRVMAHPAVPIAATQPRRFDRDHHPASRGFGVRQLLDAQWFPKCVVDRCLQCLFPLRGRESSGRLCCVQSRPILGHPALPFFFTVHRILPEAHNTSRTPERPERVARGSRFHSTILDKPANGLQRALYALTKRPQGGPLGATLPDTPCRVPWRGRSPRCRYRRQFWQCLSARDPFPLSRLPG